MQAQAANGVKRQLNGKVSRFSGLDSSAPQFFEVTRPESLLPGENLPAGIVLTPKVLDNFVV
jgi:hypothetical protein